MLIVSALLLDFALGKMITPRMPSLDDFMLGLSKAIIRRLDRPSRTLRALRIRGLLVLTAFLPPLFAAGWCANSFLAGHPLAALVTILLLMPLIGQKQQLSALIKTGRHLATGGAPPGTDPYQTARFATAQSILGYCTRLMPRTIVWCLGGFAFLIPFLLLSALMETAEKRRSGEAESPFFSAITLFFELITLPAALISSALMAAAHFFIPRTNLSVFQALRPGATFGPASRYFPLNVVALGLGLNLEAEIGEKTSSKRTSDREIKWIGPENGRARLDTKDLKQVWLISLVSIAFYLVLATMVFSLLLLKMNAE